MSTSAAPAPSDAFRDDPKVRNAVRVLSLGFVALHVYHGAVQGGGGWNARHGGLWGAIVAFFRQSMGDPVLSAGLSDFAVVAAVFGTVVIYELPPEERWGPKTYAFLALFSLFPGLGALLALLWLRPRAAR